MSKLQINASKVDLKVTKLAKREMRVMKSSYLGTSAHYTHAPRIIMEMDKNKNQHKLGSKV